MKYAIINGSLTHISKVEKGTIAKAFGTYQGYVKACKGHQKQYWKPIHTFIHH